MSVAEVTFFQKKKPHFIWSFFIEYLNTIQFFSQTRNRKSLKLGYDFKTLLLSVEKKFKISERAGSSSADKFPQINFLGFWGSWDSGIGTTMRIFKLFFELNPIFM
jgi:hypothetical protein